MWPFKSKPTDKDTTERLERLEKSFKQLEIEWTDTYDKFRRLHMRVAKQVQRLDQAPETETAQPAESDAAAATSLSERHRRLQEQILNRRNRTGGSGGLLHG